MQRLPFKWFSIKNQNEMNQFINDVLAESTFVTLNLLSEFNNQCNEFTEELLQLNSTLNKIDKIIEKESNSEKTKLQTKPNHGVKTKVFESQHQRNNWKSAGAEVGTIQFNFKGEWRPHNTC